MCCWAVVALVPVGIRTAQADPAVSSAAVLSDQKELMDLINADKSSDDGYISVDWGERDPFDSRAFKTMVKPVTPPVMAVKAPVSMKRYILTGIISSGALPSAIINDIVVGVGADVGGGMAVKAIREDSVIIAGGGREMVLTLLQQESQPEPQPELQKTPPQDLPQEMQSAQPDQQQLLPGMP